MPGKFVFVVGDNSAGASNADDSAPLSRLGLLLPETLSAPAPVIVPGQGIEEHEREIIRARTRRSRPPEPTLTEPTLTDVPLPAPPRPREVPEHRPENVLVAGPHQARALTELHTEEPGPTKHPAGRRIAGS
ncbi:hypothetical protein ACFC09_00730 [Streptomyces sp. NPDC056161]|uniref:hypothetical protein n=1 Tax=Streptomyces sp. NPDC056161 TaxID=3345732 RepID=UPI0035DF5877